MSIMPERIRFLDETAAASQSNRVAHRRRRDRVPGGGEDHASFPGSGFLHSRRVGQDDSQAGGPRADVPWPHRTRRRKAEGLLLRLRREGRRRDPRSAGRHDGGGSFDGGRGPGARQVPHDDAAADHAGRDGGHEESGRPEIPGTDGLTSEIGSASPGRSMNSFLRRIPKAELHLHLEGTLEPDAMFEMARRNGIALRFASVEDVRRAYRFSNLRSFLDIYYEGARVLCAERDFFELTAAYLERAASDGVRHAEVFFDPQTHTARGIRFGTVVRGIHSALARSEEKHGISSRLILCFLRHLSAEAAAATLEEALLFRDWICGVEIG